MASVLDRLEVVPPVEREGGSHLDELRAMRRKVADDTTREFVIPLPEYAGKLKATYQRLGLRRSLELKAAAMQSEDPAGSYADVLIAACQSVTFNGKQLTKPGSESGYDVAVADALGEPCENAREIVISAVFGGREELMSDHADAVYDWMHESHKADQERLSGESGAQAH